MKPTSPAFPQFAGEYPLPNVCKSCDDLERLHHRDLAALNDRALTIERLAVERALTCRLHHRYVFTTCIAGYMDASTWLFERLAAVRGEIGRRVGDNRGLKKAGRR